jgi:hypothetical protein
MLLYRGDRGKKASTTGEIDFELLDQWTAWYGRNEAAVTELGAPLAASGHLPNGGAATDVYAYSIVKAANVGEVQKLLADHPHLAAAGNSIDIMELTPITAPNQL